MGRTKCKNSGACKQLIHQVNKASAYFSLEDLTIVNNLIRIMERQLRLSVEITSCVIPDHTWILLFHYTDSFFIENHPHLLHISLLSSTFPQITPMVLAHKMAIHITDGSQ